ncbi:MAG: hypothetical protein ACREN7_01160 [Candidatus Dormibacteria bacterium]
MTIPRQGDNGPEKSADPNRNEHWLPVMVCTVLGVLGAGLSQGRLIGSGNALGWLLWVPIQVSVTFVSFRLLMRRWPRHRRWLD